MPEWLLQTISMIGAVLVLFPFIASAFDRMNKDGFLYAFLNCVGTFLLAFSALRPLNLGVVVLEGTWSAVSFVLCIRAYPWTEGGAVGIFVQVWKKNKNKGHE